MRQPGRSHRKKLLTNTLWLYSLQGLNYLLPMLVLPYLIRVLGVGNYGLIALAQAFAQYFTIFTDYGFNLSATKRIAIAKGDDDTTVRQTFWGVLLIKATLLIAGFALLLGITFAIPAMAAARTAYLVAYLSVLGNVLFPVWYFQGIEKMKNISIITGVSKMLTVGAVFFLVHGPADTILALALQSSAPLLAGVAGFAVAVRSNWKGAALPAFADLRLLLREGWHLFLSTAAVTLYTNTNVFLVGMLGGVTEAGYFSAAEKIIRAAQGMLIPLTQVLFPHVNTLVKESPERAVRFVRKSLLTIAVPTFAGSLAILLCSPLLSRLAFGFSNATTNSTLRWTAFIPFLVAISSTLGIQTMVVFGHEKAFSRILVTAGVFNVAFAWVLIRRMGAPGAGAAVLATETFIVLAMLWYLRRIGIHLLDRRPA
ncbi:oligosaccharide flippase family protein [Terriglobus aquaticus]